MHPLKQDIQQFAECEFLCDQFEQDWVANKYLRLEQFLANRPGKIDLPILDELILLEIDLLNAQGLKLCEKIYEQRFPDRVATVKRGFARIRQLEKTLVSRTTMAKDGKSSARIGGANANNIPAKIGSYEIIRPLGSGAFGVVQKARDVATGKFYALKFPRRKMLGSLDELQQLYNEASHAADLEHPAIVRSYGLREVDGFIFNVQQFVDGSTLAESEIRETQQIVKLIAKIATGLAFAHTRKIVHRDLKPSNILIDRNGMPLIADFGLSLHESAQRRLRGQRCGSPPYMSPEQVLGLTHQLDGRSDIWSLGVILYELLTGRRPFDGSSIDEIFEEIKFRNEKPLSMLRSDLDHELQRICLRCLAKPIRDRYPSASELSKDLDNWLRFEKQWTSNSFVPLIPRGLRSFGPQDAQAYVHLLPGLRDRFGLPDSIGFWKRQLESPNGSGRRAIGAIIGPSGSGKSSFVKAGLLPRLGTKLVKAIYVEGDARNTEERLLSEIRETIPGIPNDLSLLEVLDGIKNKVWETGCNKFLVVIDQFEQWLSRNPDLQSAQLVQALRHCDGKNLVCIVLTREDFWLKTSRFFGAIGADWSENVNVQRIDLFDKEHAQDVLYRIGRALGRLPEDKTKLTSPQQRFLENVVAECAQDGMVICVHLTMFAEMFRDREWNQTELKKVGGVSGVGQRFLELTFGDESRTVRYRRLKNNVKSVLESLLPQGGTGIRGAMKSQASLLSAAGLDEHPELFSELIDVLENDLKLITSTSKDGPAETDESKHYQLTHDYLVSSIRDWIGAELNKTHSGRARNRLKEIAALNAGGKIPSILPSKTEWLMWNFLLPNRMLSDREREIMQLGGRKFVGWLLKALAVVIVGATVVMILVLQYQRSQTANQLVGKLLGLEIEKVPEVVDDMQSYWNIVAPELQRIRVNNESSNDEVRRVDLALSRYDAKYQNEVIENITRPDCRIEEFGAALQVLRASEFAIETVENDLLSKIQDPEEEIETRLRASAIIAIFHENTVFDWASQAGFLYAAIVNEPVVAQLHWIKLLGPLGESVAQQFQQFLARATEQKSATPLAHAVYQFVKPENRAIVFANLLTEPNDVQFDSIFQVVETNRFVQPMTEQMQRLLERETHPARIANIGIGLLRLGEEQVFVDCLCSKHNSMVRSYAITQANSSRIDFETIRDLYKSEVTNNSLARQGLLMMLAQFVPDLIHREQENWLDKTARHVCLEDQHSGCFGAAELIVRRRKVDDVMALRKQRRELHGEQFGNVIIDSRLQAFAIFEPDDENELTHPIAVAMYELTKSQILCNDNVDPSEWDLPYVVTNLVKVIKYCNRLNDDEGIRKKQRPMPTVTASELGSLQIDIRKHGYRLLTIKEWNSINKACNGVMFLGLKNQLAPYYAISRGNSVDSAQSAVGSLLPNAYGLFDLYGNAFELCVGPSIRNPGETGAFLFGSDSRQLRNVYAIDNVQEPFITDPGGYDPGFRLVRSVELRQHVFDR